MDNELLSGTTILEIAHPLTEYAGLVLAGLGATVLLVEPITGSPTRLRRPFAKRGSPGRESIPFLARNTGKRSVALNPEVGEDRQLLIQMADRAGAVLEPPESPFSDILDAHGGESPRVKIVDPDGLGTSSVVGFAASGGLSSSGWPHQPPCNAPSWLALDGASIYLALMAIVGMRGRARGGPKSFEIRYGDAAHVAVTPWTRPLHSYGTAASGQGATSERLGSGPYPVFRCRDGFVRILAGTPRQWAAWVQLLGSPEALSGPAWDDPAFRIENFDATTAIAAEIVAELATEELFLKGQALGLTITPVRDLESFMADSHVNSRDFFQNVDDPDLGQIRLPRPPFREGFPRGANATISPAPALGEHNEGARNFASMGVVALPAVASGPDTGAQRRLPLEGVRVLDCGVGAVVPESASMMALLGAEVIKIESRKHLDFLRRIGLGGLGDHNNSGTFNQLNLGVKSLAVDMTTEEGRTVAMGLAAKCDVVMENLRGPVMGNWGLDYAAVRKIRPDIIYLSSQGLGAGDYDGFQTYGPNLQAFSGVTSLWAHPDDPFPVGATLNHPDHVAGKQALVLVLAALERRDRTGEGCYLDCAQFEAASYLIADKFLEQQIMPKGPEPIGNRSLDYSPHGCYPTVEEDRWCALAIEDDEQWSRFAGLVGEEWALRPEFAAAEDRIALADELDELVSTWTSSKSMEDVVRSLRGARIPVSLVVNGDDFAADASRHHDGVFECVPHPTAGPRWYAGLPIETEHGRFGIKRPPLLGEHDEELLTELLGLSPREVSRLAEKGAIGY